MKTTLLLVAVVATIALIKVQPTSATFRYTWKYWYWKKICFGKGDDKPDYDDKRPDHTKFKGSPCSEGGVCDILPCGLNGFLDADGNEEECPCPCDKDVDEGYELHCSRDFDDDDDDDDDNDDRKKRSSSEYYDGSYTDRKGYLVKWKWYNSKKYYWFYDSYNVKKTFYVRDSKRCYYYYKNNYRYEYYVADGKRHYYGTRDDSYSDSDSNSDSHSHSSSSSHSHSHSSSSSHSHSHSSSSSHSNSHSSSSSHSFSKSRDRDGCDSGRIGGKKGHNKVCFAFKDAYCVKHGFSIGYRQECLRGQDRCIIEVDDKGLYHRRCGAQSECDDLGLTQENCTHAGCKLFDCVATGCTYTLAQKNFFSFTREGKKCGCDAWCWETYIGRDDCCPDACTLCDEGVGGTTHCPQTVAPGNTGQ